MNRNLLRLRLPPRVGVAILCVLFAVLVGLACARLRGQPPAPAPRTLAVTATAYTSSVAETDGDPHLGAWSDPILPGMRAIAVSPDLLELGLDRGTAVRISGLPGKWTVLDRMPDRWTRRIDVYMGKDRDAALQWGERRVQISW